MRIIMTSTDALILESASAPAQRMVSYGSFVDELFIVIAGVGERREVRLSPNVVAVYAGGKNKSDGFSNLVMESRRIIESTSIDLVSAQDPFFVGLASYTARKEFNIPLHVQVHSDIFNPLYIFERPRRIVEFFVSLFVLRKASCIRTVSHRTVKAIRTITSAPITVLPIQVTPPNAETTYPRPSVFPEGKVALVASRLMPEKKIELVIDALVYVPDVSLVIAGSGAEEAFLKNRARNRGIADRVHFIGWQDNLESLMAHADVFIQMSLYEGFGMSLLSACLSTCPVIATNAGIAGEILQDGKHIALVKRNAQSLQKAIEEHFNNVDEARARAGRAQSVALALCLDDAEYREQYKKSLLGCVTKK